MSNLKLWDSVSKTDPAFTKKGQKGAHHFTSVAPMYQIRKATEAFGPQGLGWGIKPDSETFSEQTIGDTTLLNYDAILFFIAGDKRGEIPIHATEKLSYITKNGQGYLKIDDEARKKVVTNAKTKGLSELGMSADIFLGQFDSYEYLETRKVEAELERVANNATAKLKNDMDYKESILGSIRMISEAVNMTMLEAAFKEAVIKANARKDTATVVDLTKAKDAKKAELEEAKNDQAA